mgnify:FL=1
MGVRTKLEDEFESLMNELAQVDAGSEAYGKMLDSAMKIADRLNTIQKGNDEYELKHKEIEEKMNARISEENQNRKRNKIEWAKVAIPTTCAALMGIITMIWEKTDTMTLTPGKVSLRDVLSFRLK